MANEKPAKKEPGQELSTYLHPEKRLNNPPVGLVTARSDGVEEKRRWAYDPHVDPALQFDPGRAQIEQLIDDALQIDDVKEYREALKELRQQGGAAAGLVLAQAEKYQSALEELKRLALPYLNWAGKAEKTSFEVETVSLHVHERIDPLTILRAVQREPQQSTPRQDDLFESAFGREPLRQAIEFYKHEKGWANRLIAGDSLLVMNSLLQKESMAGKVQMIYFDPPYGIKYGSNFQPFVNKRDVKDRSDEDLTREPETLKAFRDTWELGIHSYLTYLRDRLFLAKDLLHESGSVFVQIGDENVHLVRCLLDEVFGRENFISQITVQKTGGLISDFLVSTLDYILWYGKDKDRTKWHSLFSQRQTGDTSLERYDQVQLPNGQTRLINKDDFDGTDIKPGLKRFRLTSLESANPTFDFEFHGKMYSQRWKSNLNGLTHLARANRIVEAGKRINYVRYVEDFPVVPVTDRWESLQIGTELLYVVQTANRVIERCILLSTDPGDLVFDPTCGSGTTAYVAEKWGRRWMTCDTSRIAITLAKQRLLTAVYDYYALLYPEQGVKRGFIYKTIPHITLKSIANNEEIDAIYEREHPKIEAALAQFNAARSRQQGKKKLEPLREWEVPFEFPDDWPAAARASFEAFHAARRAMQQKMDASIQARADMEILYDQPAVDKQRARVTGIFTVEAVPFPTVLSLEEAQQPREAITAVARAGESARHHQWCDELRKTGIRGKAGQRIVFADLETLPGAHALQVIGTTADSGERVAVSFGPPHAALEPRQVELALNEAEQLRPAPRLIVFAAFAFDPEAAKDIDETHWPGITLLKVQMNADLQTEDLRKKDRTSQAFWLVGQPDVELRQRADGLYEVEVRGFDYFDTRTGELQSGGRDQIALWLLDTDYDGRSLLPRQVFLPMADPKRGWHKVANNLKAVLDDARLSAYSGTRSLPFAAGEQRRIAVKLVDDRGIESLKVMPLA